MVIKRDQRERWYGCKVSNAMLEQDEREIRSTLSSDARALGYMDDASSICRARDDVIVDFHVCSHAAKSLELSPSEAD